ncbi:hypothetical protein [Roseateles sp.]|uniref:hypothetical protein n=1 Tax=Roseateles sp. TaxID=1971397 RepID=UPI0031DFC2DA
MPAEQIFGPGGMGPLEFIADVVRSLAWPGLIGLGFVLYRRQLRRFLVSAAIAVRRLNRFKYGDFEAGVAAQQAAQQATIAPAMTAIEKSIEAVAETISSEKSPEEAKEVALSKLDDVSRHLGAIWSKTAPHLVTSPRWWGGGEANHFAVGEVVRMSHSARPGSVVTRGQLTSLLKMTDFMRTAEKEGLEPAIHDLERRLNMPEKLSSSPGVVTVAHFLKRAGLVDSEGQFTRAGRTELLTAYGKMILDEEGRGRAGEGAKLPGSNIGHHDEEDRKGPAPGDPPAQ